MHIEGRQFAGAALRVQTPLSLVKKDNFFNYKLTKIIFSTFSFKTIQHKTTQRQYWRGGPETTVPKISPKQTAPAG